METTPTKVWIPSDWIQWPVGSNGSEPLGSDLRERPLRMWERAQSHLEAAENDDLRLVDAVAGLKRAVDHRVRALKKVYGFHKLDLGRPLREYERLVLLGLAQPMMVERLRSVRNVAEHEDVVPSPSECDILLEFVWYFLKSTDIAVTRRMLDAEFEERLDASSDRLNAKVDMTGQWRVHVHGWLRKNRISLTSKEDWLPVNVETVQPETQSESYWLKGELQLGPAGRLRFVQAWLALL